MILEILATLAAALFAGAALYITLVEHPARLTLLPATAVAQWRPSYRRATILQASLAVLGAALGLAAWLNGSTWLWLVAGIVLVTVIPFTLIVIMPVNRRLEDPDLDPAKAPVRELLTTWGRLHAVRTALGLAALLLMLAMMSE